MLAPEPTKKRELEADVVQDLAKRADRAERALWAVLAIVDGELAGRKTIDRASAEQALWMIRARLVGD